MSRVKDDQKNKFVTPPLGDALADQGVLLGLASLGLSHLLPKYNRNRIKKTMFEHHVNKKMNSSTLCLSWKAV